MRNSSPAEDLGAAVHGRAIDQLVETLRTALAAKHADTVDRADRIRACLDAYLDAIEAEVAAEAATKLGITLPPPGATPLSAALALRSAVEALPELRVRAAPAPPPSAPRAEAPPPTPVKAPPVDVEPAPPTRNVDAREPRQGTESIASYRVTSVVNTDALGSALMRDVGTLDLSRMPLHLFRAWAEELAARARALQDKGADPDDVPGRVIRKLTAIAYERGIGDIFGLSRKHAANWDEVADRARGRRESVVGAAAQPLTQKLAIPEAIRKTPPAAEAPEPPSSTTKETKEARAEAKERAAEAKERAEEEEAVEESGKRAELPHLHAAMARGPVVMVGGVVKQEKVAHISSRYGIEVEWVDTSRQGTQTIAGVEKRIRDRRLAAVIVLQGLIGHKHFEPLVAAARQVGLPFAYADKAGTGSVSRALTEIEKTLADQGTRQLRAEG